MLYEVITVRLRLALDRVDREVVGAGVFADDHPFVDLVLRVDEQDAAVLEIEERIGHRRAGFHRDQRPVLAAFDRPGIGAELQEGVVHDPLPFRVGEELVITSYSIHYTKLYDVHFFDFGFYLVSQHILYIDFIAAVRTFDF